jgi:TatD DNase family protein
MLIDTHAHLYLEQFDADREAMMQRAFEQGVQRIYLPNVDSSTTDSMLALEAAYPAHCFAMMGLHPCSVKENYEEELAHVKAWLWKRDFCAVGEIGTDLYWDKTFYEQQVDAFQRQMEWAKELDRPIVIHCRESIELTIDLVRKAKTEKLRGIFHCFSGTEEQAKAIIDLGFHLGIGGVLTYKKAGLEEVLTKVPLSALVLETDSPYLAPVPFRGKRNESAYIHQIAAKLASVYSVSLEQIAEQTSRNAHLIFGKNH